MRRSGLTLARLLAVLSAVCIVAAVTIATVEPATLSLGQLITLADHSLLASLQEFVHGHVSDWAWLHIVLPVLQRPAWLLPVAVGIVAAGLAATLSSRQGAPRSRRRRS